MIYTVYIYDIYIFKAEDHSNILTATDEMTKTSDEMSTQAVQQKVEADFGLQLSLTNLWTLEKAASAQW